MTVTAVERARHADHERDRFAAVDYIKAIAVVGIVVFHAGPSWLSADFTPVDKFVRHVLMSFAVPCFFLVSGFLYAGSGRMSRQALRTRLLRVLVPYLVASVVMEVCGFAHSPTFSIVVFHLITASSLGIYYFVFLLVIFVLLCWPLSRCPGWVAPSLLLALAGYAVLSSVYPALAWKQSFFWMIRNPVHFWGYFLTGWIVRQHQVIAMRCLVWSPALTRGACTAGILLYLWAHLGGATTATFPFFRALYTCCFATMIVSLSAGRSAPTPVRFLSRSTYTIYLYHYVVPLILLATVRSWLAAARISALAMVGITGPSLLVLAGGHLLGGQRSRRLLGA